MSVPDIKNLGLVITLSYLQIPPGGGGHSQYKLMGVCRGTSKKGGS